MCTSAHPQKQTHANTCAHTHKLAGVHMIPAKPFFEIKRQAGTSASQAETGSMDQPPRPKVKQARPAAPPNAKAQAKKSSPAKATPPAQQPPAAKRPGNQDDALATPPAKQPRTPTPQKKSE
eukprot:1893211-Alexandrium_andersonii.AAC.1